MVEYPRKFRTINSVILDNLSLKYQRFTSSDSKDKWIRKLEFVLKTHFLYPLIPSDPACKYGNA